jgi:hypothetical protein
VPVAAVAHKEAPVEAVDTQLACLHFNLGNLTLF